MPGTKEESDFIDFTCDTKKDYESFNSLKLWGVIYERLKNRAALLNKNLSCDVARGVDNRWKNRYRDINPYDDTRVLIDSSCGGDYINASYVSVPEAPLKRYILTQGPMQNTSHHFWLMVWEHRSPVIVMLNRIYEKGLMRCFPYFPDEDGSTCLPFDEIGLRVFLEDETRKPLFTKRILHLVSTKTGEQHRVIHLHFTTWPDFGVPSSPSEFLNFLWAVRATGALTDPDHPAVIHCSAGVGRSGAFVLIDVALHLVEIHGTMEGIDIGQLFFQLRRCRMGIIQTSDQLRFCYAAILRGAEAILTSPKDAIASIEFEPLPGEEDQLQQSSDSDDLWDNYGGDDYDSTSSEELDKVEDAEDLLEDSKLDQLDRTSAVGAFEPAHHFTSEDCPSSQVILQHEHNILPSSSHCRSRESLEHKLFELIPRINFGLVSQKPPLVANAWSDRLENNESSVHEFDISDRSNNALSESLMDEDIEPHHRRRISDDDDFEYPQAATVADSSSSLTRELSETTTTTVTSNSPPDGDNPISPRVSTEANATEPFETTSLPELFTDIDPLTSEYLEVVYASQRRRDARRQRQIRLQSQIERAQQLMREADLERKRWLPNRILRHLRHFFSESGIVQTPQGAFISSAAVVLLALSFAFAGYRYCFGVI